MAEAIVFSDAHASDGDPRGCERLISFLAGECGRAERVYILGDLFDFWFGPKQARARPYRSILEAISSLAAGGAAVTFYHGNRDFYLDERLASQFGFHIERDWSIESICGRRVLLCHGDMLCTNDVRYHQMRAILRHPATEAILTRLPAGLARALARAARRRSKRETAAKARWVLAIDDAAAREHFAKGAEVIICGHTHNAGVTRFETPAGERLLYTLGDFGADGSYLVCDGDDFILKSAKEP